MGEALRLSKRISIASDFFSEIWRTLVLASSGLLGFAAVLATAITLSDGSQGSGMLAIAVYIPEMILCFAVHEFGHASVAWLVGWRVHLVAIGSYGYLPMAKRFTRVAHGRRRRTAGMVFATAPRSGVWEKEFALHLFAGPAANLILAAAAFAFTFLLRSYWWNPLLECLAALSLITGVANLIPFRGPGSRRSDGAQLLDLARKTHRLTVTRDLWQLYGQSLDGVKPVDWDIGLVRDVEALSGTPEEDAFRDQLLLNYYLSYGDLSRCRALAERHALSAGAKSHTMMVEYAFLIALLDKNGEKAKAALDELPRRVQGESFQYWRAFAVASYVSGDNVGAREAVAKARAFAKKGKSNPDQDDLALMSAIEQDQPLPVIVSRATPS